MPLKNEVIDLIVHLATLRPMPLTICERTSSRWCGWVRPSSISPSCAPGTLVRKRSTARSMQRCPTRQKALSEELEKQDRKKSSILQKYFTEMQAVLVGNVPGAPPKDSPAIVVVGPSIMRGIDVQTQSLASPRLHKKRALKSDREVVQRSLETNKRMMPARFGEDNGFHD